MDGVTTFYTSIAEIRNFGTATEQIILQPHADFRITDAGGVNETTSYLHRDHLASVRLITNAAGLPEQSNTYTPFGDPDTAVLQPTAIPEEHSFIGERYDASTGLLFLNARYYDPDLGRFLQPDWWEVRQPGVGTNRYSYSFNDPVNLSDPSGHVGYVAQRLGINSAIAFSIAGISYGSGQEEIEKLIDRFGRNGGNFAWLNSIINGDGNEDSNQNPPATETTSSAATGGGGCNPDEDCVEEYEANQQDPNTLSRQDRKSYRTYTRNIREHQQKLDEFRANPTIRPGMEGRSEAEISAQQAARISHLEKEIATFERNRAALFGP